MKKENQNQSAPLIEQSSVPSDNLPVDQASREVQQPQPIPQPPQPTWRQIIIETDGNNIKLTKAEIAGNLELSSILSMILERIKIK